MYLVGGNPQFHSGIMDVHNKKYEGLSSNELNSYKQRDDSNSLNAFDVAKRVNTLDMKH